MARMRGSQSKWADRLHGIGPLSSFYAVGTYLSAAVTPKPT